MDIVIDCNGNKQMTYKNYNPVLKPDIWPQNYLENES